MKVYLAGSLKNKKVLEIHKKLLGDGFSPFSEWLCPGEDADDHLRDYFRSLGWNYREIFESSAVRNIFEFDRDHILSSDAIVGIWPAGKSLHLELGYAVGKGIPAFIYMEEEPDRVDVMHRFLDDIFLSYDEMKDRLNDIKKGL